MHTTHLTIPQLAEQEVLNDLKRCGELLLASVE